MTTLVLQDIGTGGGRGRNCSRSRPSGQFGGSKWRLLLVILALLGLLSQPVLAQSTDDDEAEPDAAAGSAAAAPGDGMPDTEAVARSSDVEAGPASEDAKAEEPFLKNGKPRFSITGVSPAHGPVTGDTRVTVRGGPFERYVAAFPEPKCRFGSDALIVNGAYVSCSGAPPKAGEREAKKRDRTATCVQCENSPASLESKPVEFTVSLTGDFSDVTSTATFYYYKASRVTAIEPHQGPKDGGTTVRVWGDNFVDFGEDTSCSFGTRSVRATVHAANYITCQAPTSDVVQRAMPFSVSLNGQQQSKERVDFWYYNDPQVTVLEPDLGPETGGNQIYLRGNNFKPFTERCTPKGKTEPEDCVLLDVSNSTFCAFQALGRRVRATILNSTRAACVAPPSYYWRETPVELTLNAQDYTDDATKYYYYKPPFLFDAQPSQGPVRGGTNVTVVGSNFNNTGNITCRFGQQEVPGKLRSSSEILCSAPPVREPGFVDLSISLLPGLYSSPVSYLYYKTPIVATVQPVCGPEAGYTQLTVTGENFVDLGHDAAVCVFNKTIFTNATVIDDKTILCDSPSILNKLGYSEVPEGGVARYVVDVSIDGGRQASNSSASFSYYREPKVTTVSPALGPIRGGTSVVVHGSGFGQLAACGRVVRLGHLQVEPTSFTNDTMTFVVPVVSIPSTAVIGVSLNGQQFTGQATVHDPARSITFDFYTDPYASVFSPTKGPTNGGTRLTVQGYGFMLDRPHLKDRLWARLIDPASKQELAPATEVAPELLHVDSLTWTTPPARAAQEALLQISLNGQDWVDVKDPAVDSSFGYYASPHVTAISPSYGHVKAAKGVTVELSGTGFECFDETCSDLQCRFGNHPDQYIYVRGELGSAELVRCKVPEYTKPDVLKVELTTNGESYTSDNHTYGFFDPFVLDATPRLIATDGSTQVAIKGIGFVDSGQAKALYSNRSRAVVCAGGSQCVKPATFKDKHTLITATFPQSEVRYQGNSSTTQGAGVLWDPLYIDATVIGDEFTENEVELFYYQDPILKSSNIVESPANVQSQLLIATDFQGNWLPRLVRHATPKCRFTVGQKVQITDAQIITYPFTGVRDPTRANSIHCKSPRWQLGGDNNTNSTETEEAEKATLDVSLNGQNYGGNLEFTFLRSLRIHRDMPMSGPVVHASSVKLIGQGFRTHSRDSEVKWGTQATDPIAAREVQDYTYALEDFLNTVPGSQELRAYQGEARSFPRVDSRLNEGGAYDVVTKPPLLTNGPRSLGGPAYVEVGIDEVLNYTATAADGSRSTQQWVLYNYEPSSVEFYSYREPEVQKMHPTSGLTKGGTFVEVIGTWFRYMPEYGIVPHCRFGDKIVRAHFDSSVRLVCQSPANSNVTARLPFDVSLNGVDWSNTGFEYSYYEEPIMTGIQPDMGSVQGGDQIYIAGDKFTNNTDPKEFKCRFTPVSLSIPAKTVRARFINTTTIMCPSPGGWSEADRMILQVTWNGVDYDENHFQYTFYSIHRAFPRSGPSNGRGGDIVVSGEGFRTDTSPSCMLNHTQYEPVSVTATEIRCPMPAAEAGDSFFGNVDFAITANGITWNNFEGGFQYYEQPVVEDIDPKTGPSSGVGIVNFYGQGFRADYPLAELGCKIGDATGRAFYISARQVKCVVEDIPLLAEDEDPLPAQVSLNSYSFTELSDDTYFRPYGVLHIQPNSGPIGGVTTVIVQGKGFVAEEGITPRCRFGTPTNYAIVEAEILSYGRLACRTPEALPLTSTAALPRDVPFSVAISGDEFNPWTSTVHKFRFYEQPVVEKVEPAEADVGRIVEVYVTAAEDSEFFDPLPATPPAGTGEERADSEGPTVQPASLSAMRCRFGRFGESNAVFLNATTIKCTTPPADDSPDSIYREAAKFSLAMNGQDFLEDSSAIEFTFVGTAPYISFATIVLTLLAIAFVGFAATLCTADWYHAAQLHTGPSSRGPARGAPGQLREAISRNPGGAQ